jgi:hypothetical protein
MATVTSWELLRAHARTIPGLCQPRHADTCPVCRGPVRPGYSRCYQCAQHAEYGQDLLADVVVQVSYAVRGTAFSGYLWGYKSGLAPDAAVSLLALALHFLHDHGGCVWRQAGMPAPDRLAVVPSGSGRPGAHPLQRLAAPYLRLPSAGLLLRPGRQGRDFDAGRFQAGPVAGANVLLLDDSWVSGASIQSAAAALKLAGAAHVAAVVLGRHIDPATLLGADSYEPRRCVVHQPRVLSRNG